MVCNISRDNLKSLLDSDIPILKNKDLYIYGTGNTAALFQEGLKREFFNKQIKGYCDSNPNKWGKIIYNKICINPEGLINKDNVLVLICIQQQKPIIEVEKKLQDLNIPFCLLEEAILKNHAEEVLSVYDMLNDDLSKNIYANLIYCRIKGVYPDKELKTGNQYFCWNELMAREPGNVFVDCGAYVGDSLEQFIWLKKGFIKKIIAFEPERHNYKSLKNRSKRLRKEWMFKHDAITLIKSALSNKNGKGLISNNESCNRLGSRINDCTNGNVRLVCLDDVITEPISFIKADIEAYEYKMLLGADNIIKKYKPHMAICIHHNTVDFYSIPMLIHNWLPSAKYAIRHHSAELSDTVLYVWEQ